MKYDLPFFKPPCKFAFRAHLSPKDEPKVRLVWVFPFEWTMIEQLLFLGVYERFKTDIKIMHFGDKSMSRLIKLLNYDIEKRG